jgi:hypothetical protein
MRFSGAAKLSTLEHALKRDSLNIHQLLTNFNITAVTGTATPRSLHCIL